MPLLSPAHKINANIVGRSRLVGTVVEIKAKDARLNAKILLPLQEYEWIAGFEGRVIDRFKFQDPSALTG